MEPSERDTKTGHHEEKAILEKEANAPVEPNLTRAPSMASTILPAYNPSDEPPPYSEPGSTSRQPAARLSRPAQPSSTGHEGSCGMPASMVMSVVGGSSGASASQSGKAHSGRLFAKTSETGRLATNERGRTYGRWNVQGTTLSDFGNPFRRSK